MLLQQTVLCRSLNYLEKYIILSGRYFQIDPQPKEAVAQRCSVNKVFLEISENSQENI